MKKLPLGIQVFSEIIEDDYVYIDKTKEAFELITDYKYVFLSRPRRFGKSLFLDTLSEIFKGSKQLFEGLYIEDKYSFEEHPVIHISFGSGNFETRKEFNQFLYEKLYFNQENLEIKCPDNFSISGCFEYLIKKAYEKYEKKVVVLIDEYDKPILDNIDNFKEVDGRKQDLKNFYSVLKDSNQYLRFVFLTGVTKFAKVSIFSGLNNIKDITLNPKYGNICGYTQKDVETTFQPYLKGVDMEKLKLWYNGYNFLKDKVYNPYDILLFIDEECEYKNYWFGTGNPSFLIKLIKQQNYFMPGLENIIAGDELLDSFDPENINMETLLFQSGYLTVKEKIQIGSKIKYSLKIPNKEVKMSLNDRILIMLINNRSKVSNSQDKAFYALRDSNLEDFKTTLISLFASLPYESYAKNNIYVYEGFYSNIVYTYLASLGFPVSVEESTNKGRLDMSILINNNRYVFEFKVGNENALNQIKQNTYWEKFLNEGSNIYLVGINFNKEEKNISNFEWEKLHKNFSNSLDLG
ncbi:MAG: hypothetical protein CSA18_03445 [Deltaproteobacteria bacterium]|nr:MAG: hypothetical protein CSA18_03445 [Deltaproteobacteria bacterium]